MLVKYSGFPKAVLRTVDDFGFISYDLVGLPRRLLESKGAHTLVETSIDKRRTDDIHTPATQLLSFKHSEDDNWLAQSTRSLSRLYAAFLIAEDPQRRLDVRKVSTLMHQVSLVQHILQRPELKKVLIGDEVGLGKTIEAGLLVRQILEQDNRARILYLAPARLVSNVSKEFREKLEIDARVWTSGNESDARLEDDKIIIASIHKAVFGKNLSKVAKSGPWDVVIVDECHHLSDWGVSGGQPNQSYKLVSQLVKNQPEDGRLILMSGTPHQGNEVRFKNILRLLSDDEKNFENAAGRVIFRTKDRVKDWFGNPLFPPRDVREPLVIDLGEKYKKWYSSVANLYNSNGLKGVRLRAAGWAKGQALQWAASSVQAGLGFLTRLAMRRLGWDLENEVLRQAISALRPYRGGPKNEPLELLYQRLCKQIGRGLLSGSLQDDEEEVEEYDWIPDPVLLEKLILDGIELIRDKSSMAKWEAVFDLIDQLDGEKVVLFAQPVETVTVVASELEKRYGCKPALIIGNQDNGERAGQVESFQSQDGPRFLVSSKAGSEGLNMQCARCLIHLDVPWNPMELEQRVGRVHRFGSQKTIIVNTVVADGSREVDMYRIARQKLSLVAQHLAPDQFEALFSRVMSLVPPKELESILGNSSNPLKSESADGHKLGRLVDEGYRNWSNFDDVYRMQAEQIRESNPGEATWEDLAAYLIKYHGAKPGSSANFSSFRFSKDEIQSVREEVPTIFFDGTSYSCGDTSGLGAISAEGNVSTPLGLNLDCVRDKLKMSFLTEKRSDVAYVNLHSMDQGKTPLRELTTYLFFLRQKLQVDSGRWSENATNLLAYSLPNKGGSELITGSQLSRLVRCLSKASRIKDPSSLEVRQDLRDVETDLFGELRQLTQEDIENGFRYAVWPLCAVVAVP